MRFARAAFVAVGLALAASGGVIAYRAAFVEPRTAVVISEEGVREVPSTPRVVGGLIVFALGVTLAIYAARRRA